MLTKVIDLFRIFTFYYLNTDNGGTYPWYTVGLCSHVSTISWLASPVSLCYAPPSTVCGLTWSHSSPQSSSQPHWDSCRVHFWRDTSSYALSTTPELSSPSASSPIVFVAPHRPPSSRGTSRPLLLHLGLFFVTIVEREVTWLQTVGYYNNIMTLTKVIALQLSPPQWIIQILSCYYLSRSCRHPSQVLVMGLLHALSSTQISEIATLIVQNLGFIQWCFLWLWLRCFVCQF